MHYLNQCNLKTGFQSETLFKIVKIYNELRYEELPSHLFFPSMYKQKMQN